MKGNKKDLHKGFAEALDSVWHEINDALSKFTCPIYYTGHSLGAALATLAAARFTPAAVYTFGSPRVGDTAFVTSISQIPIYRVVDDKDIVTTAPPEAMGFRHVGAVHKLTGIKDNSILVLLKRLFSPPNALADHAPINYVDRI